MPVGGAAIKRHGAGGAAMMFIFRPTPGTLALHDEEKPLTYGIPDEKFWVWLRASGNEAKLEKENPARMERVRKNGVGVLHNHKQALIDAGFATLDECVSKRPVELDPVTKERPVLLAKVPQLCTIPDEVK